MVQGHRVVLPVEVFVHIEGVDFSPADPFTVSDLSQERVLTDRTDRQDQTGRFASGVVRCDLVGDDLGEVLVEGDGVGEDLLADFVGGSEVFGGDGKVVAGRHRVCLFV
jgi:hypothetical protein